MTAYKKAKGLLRGRGLGLKIKYKIKNNLEWQQHMTTQHNMAAAQHGSSTKHGTNVIGDSTKGKKVETTIHHAKQTQLSVSVHD